MARDVHNAAPAGRSGSRAHRSITQRFDWRLGGDVHILHQSAIRSGAGPHRRHSQRGEWISTADIHIGIGALCRFAVHRHRSNTQDRECARRPDIQVGPACHAVAGLALTAEIHRASSGCDGRCSHRNRHCHPVSRRPSPLKTTALRVGRRAGYPHERESADRSRTRVSKHTDDRQPTPDTAHRPIGRRRSPSKYTVPRVVSAAGYPYWNPCCLRSRAGIRAGPTQHVRRLRQPNGHILAGFPLIACRRSPLNCTALRVA